MPRVHAFFDFDDTLLSGDSILYWLRYYYRRRPARRVFQLANWAGLILFALRLIDSHALKRIFLMPMGLESPADLDLLAADFVREDLSARFHVPVLQRLWTHHLLGHKVVILSASGTFYLRHLKAFLPMADIQGTELIWPKGGFGLPRYRDGNLRGENKIIRLKALGYGEAGPFSFAYSDHQHDRFLLRFAEFPICTRPTAKLRRLAKDNGWPVMDWPDGPAPSADGTFSTAVPGSFAEGVLASAKAFPAGKRKAWKVKLGKFGLLVFSAGSGLPPTGSDPLREAAAAREYAPGHTRALRERVRLRYPEPGNQGVYKAIFGESGPEREGTGPLL
ncbi:MAG: haloacid dehalogenase-like hydrolase [Fibrobacteres bacterium]|nr:haloacid dehalogenase-like hydrolase [Fibrobacterota bacterium]